MHPIVADPDLVQAEAVAITTASGQLQDAARKLSTLGWGGVKSEAVDALQTNVRELAVVLSDAWVRYEYAGEALTTYAPILRTAVNDVNQAIAAMAHTDVHGATLHAGEAEAGAALQSANPFASQHDRDEATIAADHAKENLHQQQLAASAAQTKYDTALADLAAAAAAATKQIELGVESSQLNDSFMDHVQHILDDVHKMLSAVLKAVYEVLDFVSTLLSLLSAALLVIAVVIAATGIGAPVAAFFAAAAEIVGMAADVASAAELEVQVMRYALGDITFGELMSTVIVTTAALLLSAFGGKIWVKAGEKVGAKTWNKLFSKGLGGEDEGDQKMFEFLFDSGDDAAKDPLAKFIDDHYQPPAEVTHYLQPGQWQLPGQSHDIDQLTPDFSGINVQNIINDSFTVDAPPASCPVYANVVVASGVA